MMDDERKNDIKSMSIADKLRVRRAQSEHDTKSGEIVGTTYGAVIVLHIMNKCIDLTLSKDMASRRSR